MLVLYFTTVTQGGKMRYAIIGCGRISPNHIAAAQSANLEIVGLCDLLPEKMDALSHNFRLDEVSHYSDYVKMIKEQQPDLIAIATDSGSHGQIAMDCLDLGVNLIIEKPITLSLTEADAIIEKAEEKGLVVSACHQNRFNKSIQKIREAIDNERFGKLLHATAHIRWNRNKAYYDQAKWRGTWAHDGGALMNQCIHNIDLLRWMMGDEVVEVYGIIDNLMHDYIEGEDLGLALVKFGNGSYGLIEGTNNVYPKNLEETLYIFGEQGTVKAGGNSVNLIEVWEFQDKLDDPNDVKKEYSEIPPNVYGFGHTPLYSDVVSAIKEGRPPYVTAVDGRNALELVLAIYSSSLLGKPVKLPLKKGATIDFVDIFNN